MLGIQPLRRFGRSLWTWRGWRGGGGRLYMHAKKDEQKRWAENGAGNLVLGDKTWRTIRDKAPKAL